VVSSLAAQPTGRDACTAAGVAPDDLPNYERALTTLAESGMICKRRAP
jgi:putative mycofactocin binding protein MftB